MKIILSLIKKIYFYSLSRMFSPILSPRLTLIFSSIYEVGFWFLILKSSTSFISSYPYLFLLFIPLYTFFQVVSLRNNKVRDEYIQENFKPPIENIEKRFKDYSTFKVFIYSSSIILSILIVINFLYPALINFNNTTKVNSTNTTNIISAVITKTNFNNTKANSDNSKNIYSNFIGNDEINIFKDSIIFLQLFFTIILMLSIISIFPSLFLTDFKLSIAKQYCNIALKKNDEIEKAKYILYSLNWYNYYLRKTLDLQIKNKDKLLDNIIMNLNEKTNLLENINDALNKNELELIKILIQENSKNSTSNEENTKEPFLTKFTYADKIKGLSNFIIPITTVAISIIGLILKK
jgi:hypothetical protein